MSEVIYLCLCDGYSLTLFLVSLGLTASGFVADVLVGMLACGKRRVRVSFFLFALFSFTALFAILNGNARIVFCALNASFSFALAGVLFLLGETDDYVEKAYGDRSKEKELIKLIDSKIKEENCAGKNAESEAPQKYIGNNREIRRTTEAVECKPKETEKVKDNTGGLGIDFSNVKSVISRLDCFPLTQADRRTVHELEVSVSEAERGCRDGELKERINDGLGALLKIMSKYGA